MRDWKPVNIMGVIAFPNPNEEDRVIRFIDSEYHTLFTIKNGESIVITRFDGEKLIFPCDYIDNYHLNISNSAYHICEFAEMQERSGNLYTPLLPSTGDMICTYEIYQIPATADICFCSYEKAKGKIKRADYRRVYAGMYAAENSLENIWNKHNRDNRPFAHQMRSMSVSDVVVLTQGNRKTAYYADTFGFQAVLEFLNGINDRKKVHRERGDAR